MKLNKIAMSCALALAILSSQAYALTAFEAPDYDLAQGKYLDVLLSGASNPEIIDQIARRIFDPRQGIFVFYDDGGTPDDFTDDGKSYRAYFGVVAAILGVDPALVGKKVRLQHRTKDDSTFGVEPLVGTQQGLANMNVSSATCVFHNYSAGPAYDYACAKQGTDWGGSKVSPNRVPDFGVSALEPRMFKAPYNTKLGHAQVDVSGLMSFATYAIMFGVPVTTSVPSTTYISKAALAGMLNGDVQDWHQVDPAIPAGTNVIVCRRVQGSGTQAIYNSLFSHFPCESGSSAGTGTIPPATASSSASVVLGTTGDGSAGNPFVIRPMDGYTIVESDSSGKVRDCLKAAKNGSGPTGSNGPITFLAGDGSYYRIDFGSGNYSAVGALSLDSAGHENGWSFRSLDGVAPTNQNLIDLKYDLASEQSMQYRADLFPSGSTTRKFIDLFIKRAGGPLTLGNIANGGVRNSVAALPMGYAPPLFGNNVMRGTRFGNSCSPIRQLY